MMSYGLRHSRVRTPDHGIPYRMYEVVSLLLDAHRYAAELNRNPWDFAVEFRSLRSVGLTTSDFRWLVCKGFVKHAREVTPIDEDERTFQRVGNLTLTRKTCVVLTEAGATFAMEVLIGRTTPSEPRPGAAPHPNGLLSAPVAPVLAGRDLRPLPVGPVEPLVGPALVPKWDHDRQELRLGGVIVKQFKVPAPNQEVILAAFEEESWPVRIDDPLPVHPCIAAKRRLHETITSLNRNQRLRVINFSGDGSGQGVRWEALIQQPRPNGVH